MARQEYREGTTRGEYPYLYIHRAHLDKNRHLWNAMNTVRGITQDMSSAMKQVTKMFDELIKRAELKEKQMFDFFELNLGIPKSEVLEVFLGRSNIDSTTLSSVFKRIVQQKKLSKGMGPDDANWSEEIVNNLLEAASDGIAKDDGLSAEMSNEVRTSFENVLKQMFVGADGWTTPAPATLAKFGEALTMASYDIGIKKAISKQAKDIQSQVWNATEKTILESDHFGTNKTSDLVLTLQVDEDNKIDIGASVSINAPWSKKGISKLTTSKSLKNLVEESSMGNGQKYLASALMTAIVNQHYWASSEYGAGIGKYMHQDGDTVAQHYSGYQSTNPSAIESGDYNNAIDFLQPFALLFYVVVVENLFLGSNAKSQLSQTPIFYHVQEAQKNFGNTITNQAQQKGKIYLMSDIFKAMKKDLMSLSPNDRRVRLYTSGARLSGSLIHDADASMSDMTFEEWRDISTKTGAELINSLRIRATFNYGGMEG